MEASRTYNNKKKDAKQRQLSFYKNNGKKINKEVNNFSSFNFLKF